MHNPYYLCVFFNTILILPILLYIYIYIQFSSSIIKSVVVYKLKCKWVVVNDDWSFRCGSHLRYIMLNTDTPTRVSNHAHQQPTSPDITTISSSLYNRTSWTTIHALNSDHLPILITIQTDNKHTIQHNRRSYTNYRKADWDKFTQDTEDAFTAIQPPKAIHDAKKTFTNTLYQAGNQHIPVGKIRNTDKLLPYPIRNKIAHRNITSKTRHKIPLYRSQIKKYLPS